MAGIGIKLQKIYEKKTILAYLTGFGYSAVVTVAPMFVVIGTIMLMSQLLGYENVGYARRGLFSGTLLYIFIFSLLTAAPFNAVLSLYMSDVIYEERYEDILPCYDVGLLLNILLASLLEFRFAQGTSCGTCQSDFCVYRDFAVISHWFSCSTRCFTFPSVRIIRRYRCTF